MIVPVIRAANPAHHRRRRQVILSRADRHCQDDVTTPARQSFTTPAANQLFGRAVQVCLPRFAGNTQVRVEVLTHKVSRVVFNMIKKFRFNK